MIQKLVLAVVVGVVVTLLCILVGTLLAALKIDLAVVVGEFVKQWSAVFGILAALWYYFSGTAFFNRV